MMQKIYIDISNLAIIDFLTGIQRVVRNVVLEMLEMQPERIVLLSYSGKKDRFNVIDKNRFQQIYNANSQKVDKTGLLTSGIITVKDMEPGSIFFDLDAIWAGSIKRSELLPLLKNQGIRCAVNIYDIIPVRMPQFCSAHTVVRFLNYLGAYLQYGDLLITSTQSVLDDVYDLMDSLHLPRIPGGFSWLGSDPVSVNTENPELDESILADLSGKKYVLCVGTIEPRKNLQLVLDAFDQKLFEEGYSLVMVGKIGWDVQSFIDRVNEHELKGSQLFHYMGINDDTLSWIYNNACCVAFPTFGEGFGLPVVEAFERHTPVIASDRPVIREVGKDLADYFDPESADEFIAAAEKYLADDSYRAEKVRQLDSFQTYTWHETAEKMLQLLDQLKPEEIEVKQDVHQMVILTARADAIGPTLKYIDRYMEFIDEIVLCCPESAAESMKTCYSGRMKLKVLTDDQVLNGKALPEDHQCRNVFLRICAMELPEIDDVFIMSDDDYRPMRPVSRDFYVKDGRYNAYYFYDIDKWRGVPGGGTSFDYGVFRTRAFLEKNHLPLKHYSCHMPQIIDKRVYLEMARKYPEIAGEGLDEWSPYFNYLTARYPFNTDNRVYKVLGWPGRGVDWPVLYTPSEYVFENYYEELYEEGRIFAGMSQELCDQTEEENRVKERMYWNDLLVSREAEELRKMYRRIYEAQYNEIPSIVLRTDGETMQLTVPEYTVAASGIYNAIPFTVQATGLPEDAVINAQIDVLNRFHPDQAYSSIEFEYRLTGHGYELPLSGMPVHGEMILSLTFSYKDLSASETCRLFIVSDFV